MLPVLFLLAAMVAGRDAQPGQYAIHSSDPAINRAGQLLNLSRPSQALELLQAAIERNPRDPGVLLLAGLAAYRSDQVGAALGYWGQSLDLAPNTALRALYEDAKREAAADRSGEKLEGTHVALRYEEGALPDDTARDTLRTLEENYSRISAALGCTANERIVAIVETREQYLLGAGDAEWSGGYYDGRIHIVWPPGVVWKGGSGRNPRIERALAHELVHACLASMPSGSSPWPVWLQEGLAQKLSGDKLAPSVREQVRQLARMHGIPRLEDLGRDWLGMPQQDAQNAYNLSLAAVDALYSGNRISPILSNPDCLPEVVAALEAELGF
jgi:tetratricopeptide (TPR) repeat protein